MPDESPKLLQVSQLEVGYGKRPVLHDIDLHVGRGEIVALIGHNGAGKSTLLKAVFGMLAVSRGKIRFENRLFRKHEPPELLRAGVAYVPQGNRVFLDLTVRENLLMSSVSLRDRRSLRSRIDMVLREYPLLESKLTCLAGTLSGGERQMVALGLLEMLQPRLLLLDEPSLGLAPRLVVQALQRIQRYSRRAAVSVLIVEQKVREVLKISDRAYVLRNGRVSYEGAAKELQDAERLREAYL